MLEEVERLAVSVLRLRVTTRGGQDETQGGLAVDQGVTVAHLVGEVGHQLLADPDGARGPSPPPGSGGQARCPRSGR